MRAQAFPGNHGSPFRQSVTPDNRNIWPGFHELGLFRAEAANANFGQGNAHLHHASLNGGMRKWRTLILLAQVAMCIDVYNRQVGKIITYSCNWRSRKRVLAANCKRKLPSLQDFTHGIARSSQGGSMIHPAVIKSRTSVYTSFDGAPIEFLIVQFHLAGGIKNRLRPMFGAFHIAHAIL